MTDPDGLLAIGDRKTGQSMREKVAARLADWLQTNGYTDEELGRLSRVEWGTYQGLIKNANDQAEIHTMTRGGFVLRASPSWDDGPKWQPVDRGPAVKVSQPKGKPPVAVGEVTVVLPDMQVGYFRTADGELEPIHDERAIDAALSVVKALRPARVVLLGDNLDAADFGRYRLSPAFAATTQAAVDYLSTLCGRLRAAAPEADIVWLAGNHEERLQNYILDNARAAFGLRQANPTPADWPVLSLPHLCRLDDHGVEYRTGYPASEVWLSPTLRCIHGNKVRSKGSTAHAYLPDARTSVIYGHIHRIEQAYVTRTDHDGPVTVMAASPGCLARTDGVVPSSGQGLDLDGRPLRRPEDWQSGFAVVTVDGPEFLYEQATISDGVAWFRGKRYGGD